MKRRELLKVGTATGAGLLATAVAAPVIAQSQPELKWRMASTFPQTLEILWGTAVQLVKRVGEITDGRFKIQLFGPGEIVPAFQVLDATQNGTVEMGWTSAYYYWGKDPSFAFFTAVPFGFNARLAEAWYLHGGGAEFVNEVFKDYNCHCIQTGNTTAQMGGFFRKEIRTLSDLQGLKFRIGGFAGNVVKKLGVVPQLIPPGDIYPALEKGAIDAVEWVGPADDEKLGLAKIAKYYYYPGWWEGGAVGHTLINLNKWNELPANYKAALTAAAREAGLWMTAKYDAANPAALKRLIANGALLRPFSEEIMDAAYKATEETMNEFAANNTRFSRIYESVRAHVKEGYQWWQVCEISFDSYQIRKANRS
jgi:TRAP-type mannitol/chloroaromatic compound transport system substrate-binding protein